MEGIGRKEGRKELERKEGFGKEGRIWKGRKELERKEGFGKEGRNWKGRKDLEGREDLERKEGIGRKEGRKEGIINGPVLTVLMFQ